VNISKIGIKKFSRLGIEKLTIPYKKLEKESSLYRLGQNYLLHLMASGIVKLLSHDFK
jgi:hypothetical protein